MKGKKKTPAGNAGVNNIPNVIECNTGEIETTETEKPNLDAPGITENTINLENIVLDNWDCADLNGKFVLKQNGVFFIRNSENKDEAPPAPIKICDYLRVTYWTNTTDKRRFGIILEWKDQNGLIRTLPVGAGQIQNKATEIRGALADLGLENIKPKGGSNSRDYLQYYLLTAKPNKKLELADKLGWLLSNNYYFYIMPNETIGDPGKAVVFDNSHLINMDWIKTAGTLAEWQEQIAKPALASNRCTFAICVVFASPLMDFLDGYVDSRFFEFTGDSSVGKTTALKFAQSVLGYRKELPNWRATANGLEATALAHNDCTMFLDELGVADKPENILNFVYMLCGGTTRIRGNVHLTANKEKNWTLLGLASGESSLEQLVQEHNLKKQYKPGQEIRLPNIPVDAGKGFGIFEKVPDGYADMPEFFQKITVAFRNQHGTAFDAWIKRLVSIRNFSDKKEIHREILINRINEFVAEALKGELNNNKQIARVAKTFGLVAIAGDIASGGCLDPLAEKDTLNITGWQCNDTGNRGNAWKAVMECFKAWLAQFGASKLSKESQRIIEHTKLLLSTERSRFQAEWDKITPPKRIGYIRKSKDFCLEYLIDSTCYKEYICEGKTTKQVDEILEQAGMFLGFIPTYYPKLEGILTDEKTRVRILVNPGQEQENNLEK